MQFKICQPKSNSQESTSRCLTPWFLRLLRVCAAAVDAFVKQSRRLLVQPHVADAENYSPLLWTFKHPQDCFISPPLLCEAYSSGYIQDCSIVMTSEAQEDEQFYHCSSMWIKLHLWLNKYLILKHSMWDQDIRIKGLVHPKIKITHPCVIPNQHFFILWKMIFWKTAFVSCSWQQLNNNGLHWLSLYVQNVQNFHFRVNNPLKVVKLQSVIV